MPEHAAAGSSADWRPSTTGAPAAGRAAADACAPGATGSTGAGAGGTSAPLVRARPGWAVPGIARSGVRAILFDRDGTLVEDVPYNGDPDHVRLLPTVRSAVAAVREAGVAVGVVTNQSGLGRGLLTQPAVDAVATRIEQLLGSFDVWVTCPHLPSDRCPCRKPAPGGLLTACSVLGLPPRSVGYVGDIGGDVSAARAGGLRPVMVPTPATRADEIRQAPEIAPDLLAAVVRLLAPRDVGTWV